MARTKARSKKSQSITQFETYTKKPEFWLGLATVFIFLFLLSRLPFHETARYFRSYRLQLVRVTPVVAKPVVQPATVVSTPTPAGITQYVVQENDSYSNATLKVCGSELYYAYNQELNENKPLSIGETIVIRCNWEQ